jgi:signal transduction histidine kinase/CheY-like chemotaxis protein
MVRQPNNQIYKTVVVVWLTLSAASVVLAAATWLELSHKLSTAREAIAINEELDSVLRLLLDIETSQRGYAITGNKDFLEPAVEAEKALPTQFDGLADLTRGDSAMLKRVMDLRAETELFLNHHRKLVSARASNGISGASKLIASGEGKRIMDAIRSEIAEVRWMRFDLISDSGTVARRQFLRASVTSLVAGALGIGAGIFALGLSRLAVTHQERERVATEAKLQAERSSREKTVFLANMSHEIRTPMNAILGFSELLQSDLRDPQQRRYLQSIRSSADLLLQLINDILDMSKIEAGVLELRPEPTDPREICKFIEAIFAQPAGRKGVRLESNVAEDVPAALLLDRIRLRQILVNLVGNAVKFTDHGEIGLQVRSERQQPGSHATLLIDVRDTGVGIPPDRLGAIFEPFVQAGAHRDRERQGTGLGLTIVQRLTEAMGGTVSATSRMGEGSTFHLRLPDVAISARLPLSQQQIPSGEFDFNLLRPSTVLVVDDNELNCQLIAGLFAGTHHTLVFGTNGQEAVTKAIALKPDVILLDLRMPGMDGSEALDEIRRIPGLELLPVIAVTASSLLAEEPSLRERFNGYLRKPFAKRELFTELAQFLRRQPQSEALHPDGPATNGNGLGIDLLSPGLVAELQEELAAEWPAMRARMGMNEIRTFAGRLEAAGQRWHCPSLVHYAMLLRRDADAYAVADLEQHLEEFGRVVEPPPAPPAS